MMKEEIEALIKGPFRPWFCEGDALARYDSSLRKAGWYSACGAIEIAGPCLTEAECLEQAISHLTQSLTPFWERT